MELSKTNKSFYFLTGFAVIFILLLGAWWLYLVFKLAIKLQFANIPSLDGNLLKMIQWEGLTFFGLLVSVAFALFYFFYQDHKKTKALHSFFASLTHELKTPLASIKLQSEVLNDFIEHAEITLEQKTKITKYTKRLVQDSSRLESEMDKHLQLSRLERNGGLNLVPVELKPFLQNELKRFSNLEIEINSSHEDLVLIDEMAFSIIIKNLIENSTRHNPNLNKITIEINNINDAIEMTYTDHGINFNGDLKELGKLFYKFNSPKGSGIGLYLIKSLIKKMEGKFIIKNESSLVFIIRLKKGNEIDA